MFKFYIIIKANRHCISVISLQLYVITSTEGQTLQLHFNSAVLADHGGLGNTSRTLQHNIVLIISKQKPHNFLCGT